MTTIQTTGKLLTASVEARTLTYKLLPYGEAGRTNVGRVTASRGALTLPEPAELKLNIEHDRTRPVGRAVVIEDTDEGLLATFAIANTRAGNDLLEEAAEGLRAAVSVEIDNPVIRAGRLMGGALSAAGAVVDPAFPSALLVAADAGELPADAVAQVAEALKTALDVVEAYTEGDEPEPKEITVAETTMTAATAPAGGLAASKTAKPEPTKGEVFKMLAGAFKEGGAARMLAALSDIVPANTPGMEQPKFVGELWSGKAHVRKIAPLFNHDVLTSFTVRGWRWVTKPVVAAYSGDKTAVPSATVLTEAVDLTAERIAGAHDVDRKYKDFGDSGFFESYYKAMTESYSRVSDAEILADIRTAAVKNAVTRGTVPASVSTAMTAIVDGALEVLTGTDSPPTFALVATDLYRELVLTRSEDALAYLNAALGLEDGTIENFHILPSAALNAGQVLVGVRDAATVHELGGGAPIRVEAENIANGGIDTGVFGYYAVNIHDQDGLTLVVAAWVAATAYVLGDVIVIAGKALECTTAGTSDAGAPAAPGAVGGTVVDGTATWTRRS